MSNHTPTPEPDPTHVVGAVPPASAVPPTPALPSIPATQPQAASGQFPPGQPPSNLYLPGAGSADTAGDWHAAYLNERKKSRILGVTTAAAAVLAVVFGVWGIAQTASTPSAAAGAVGAQGQLDGNFGGPGMGGPGALGGQGMAPPDGAVRGGLLEQMINADGTINQTAVDQFKTQMSAGNGPPAALVADIAAREVAQGDLTQAQADQILAALGVSASASSGTTTSSSATSTLTTTA